MSPFEQAVVEMRAAVALAAVGKLGRRLSPAESQMIEAITSLMMLESLERSFLFEKTSASDVEHCLAHLTTPTLTSHD